MMMGRGRKLETDLASWPRLVKLGSAYGVGERMGRREIGLLGKKWACQNPRSGGGRPRFLQKRGRETSEEAAEVIPWAVLDVDDSCGTGWSEFHGDYPLGKKWIGRGSGRVRGSRNRNLTRRKK